MIFISFLRKSLTNSLFTLCMLIIHCGISKAQLLEDWTVYQQFSPTGAETFSGGCVIDDYGYIYNAIRWNTGPYDMQLTKLDSDGDTVWIVHRNVGYFFINDIQIHNDQIYIAKNSTPEQLIKYDLEGNIVKTFNYGSGSHKDLAVMSFDGSGHIYAMMAAGNNPLLGRLLKMDTSFNIIWDVETPGAYIYWEGNIDYFDNSDLLVLYSGWGNSYDSYLLRIDTSGNVLWVEQYQNTLMWRVQVDKDQNCIVTGTQNQTQRAINMRVNGTTGNLLWYHLLNMGVDNSTWDIQFLGDYFYATGSVSFTSQYTELLVMKFDLMGNVVDSITYSTSLYESYQGVDLMLHSDSTFYLFAMGGANPMGYNRTIALILNLDEDLNIIRSGVHLEPSGQMQSWKTAIHPSGDIYLSCDQEPGGINYAFITKFCIDNCEYNTSGTVYLDEDSNCLNAINEQGVTHHIVSIDNGSRLAMTDTAGRFNLKLPTDSHSIKVLLPLYWNSSCPSGSYHFSLSDSVGYIDSLDFGIYPTEGIQDLVLSMGGTPIRPGFTQQFALRCDNIGVETVNSWVTLEITAPIQIISTTPPADSVFGNRLAWNIPGFVPGQHQNFMITTFVDSNIALINQLVQWEGTAHPLNSDYTPNDNVVIDSTWITGAYDPNSKEVNPSGLGQEGAIHNPGERLEYTIHFQNVGTDTAFSIRIRDSIDYDLDIASLRFGAYSHPYSWNISGNGVLQFDFQNIQLPDSNIDVSGSQGFINYSLKLKPYLTWGSVVKNRAHIQFDFNPAITTNTVINTLTEPIPIDTSTGILERANQVIAVIPNPFTQTTTLQFPNPENRSFTLNLTDISGKELLCHENITGQSYELQRGQLPAGLYFIKLGNGEWIYREKVVVR